MSQTAAMPASGRGEEYRFELRRVANWVPLGLMYAAF